jgi:hypothetical protein
LHHFFEKTKKKKKNTFGAIRDEALDGRDGVAVTGLDGVAGPGKASPIPNAKALAAARRTATVHRPLTPSVGA